MADCRHFRRAVAVLCRQWGKSPPEVYEMCDSGRLALEDAIEGVLLAASTPFVGEAVIPFITRERAAEEESRADELRKLAALVRSANDPGLRERLVARMRQIQDGGRDGKTG